MHSVKSSAGNTLALQVDSEGNVRYDAIAQYGTREGQKVQSSFRGELQIVLCYVGSNRIVGRPGSSQQAYRSQGKGQGIGATIRGGSHVHGGAHTTRVGKGHIGQDRRSSSHHRGSKGLCKLAIHPIHTGFNVRSRQAANHQDERGPGRSARAAEVQAQKDSARARWTATARHAIAAETGHAAGGQGLADSAVYLELEE